MAAGLDGAFQVLAVRDGQVEESLATVPQGHRFADAAVSPDGSTVAYVTVEEVDGRDGPATLRMQQRGGEAVEVLTTEPYEARYSDGWGSIRDLAWNVDGSQLAFAWRKAPLHTEVYAVDADGSRLRHLTPPDGGDWTSQDDEPFWGPEPDVVYFQAARDRRGTIWRTRTDGSGAERLTPPIEPHQFNNAAVSPDGRWLVTVTGNADEGGLWMMDLAAPDDFQEIYPLPLAEYHRPLWSPDGTKLAHAAAFKLGNSDQPSEAVVVRPADGSVERLETPCGFTTMRWASDSSHLLLGNACAGTPQALDVDTGEVVQLPDLWPADVADPGPRLLQPTHPPT